MSISGNMVGSYSQIGKTFILTDENGNELTGVLVDQMTIFNATDNDVREGMVYAGDEGVSTGTKNIPAYRTTQGVRVIKPDNMFSITLSEYDKYNYTQLQCMMAPLSANCAIDKVGINDGVYNTGSNDKIADIIKNSKTKSIDLNVNNTSSANYLLYFFTYKEEY